MEKVRPVNYHIQIEPDFSDFTFSGNAEIEFKADPSVSAVDLHVLELDVKSCQLVTGDGLMDCRTEQKPEREMIRIILPEPRQSSLTLRIDYRGIINEMMAGMYRSRYVVDGEQRYIAVTQFQESDARRVIPCVDHPAAKATFEIDLLIDQDLTGISNCDIAHQETIGEGKKRIRFEKTPVMSTYLVFIGVGAFTVTPDRKDPRVRSVTLPYMTDNARFGLEFARKTLDYCEQYYGIPYALSKLDLIAVPDFAFGAMENWGAMTFRENLLLHYSGTTSRSGEARICEVIAHEIAHQWFGNLVTPSDWKFLWLNESFATYFGYGVVDFYYPQWQTWDHFLHGQTQTALNRDALHETFPIEIPGGEHVVINTSTAPIIYSKGASILRQIEGFIGTDRFKKGIQTYLETHAYGAAESRDLWSAFEEASEQPITAMTQNWIEQPGHPLIRVHREGDQCVLEQERFTFLPGTFHQHWMIPVTMDLYDKTGNCRQKAFVLTDRQMKVDIGKDTWAVKINRRQTGFYRVFYEDSENLKRLGQLMANRLLPDEDRWGLEHDFFAQVKCGSATMEAYLDFLKFYDGENGFLPLSSISTNLFFAYLVMPPQSREKIVSSARAHVDRVLARIGTSPVEGEPHSTAILRDQLLWQGVVYQSKESIRFTAAQFDGLMKGNAVHPDIKKSIMCAGALNANADAFTWFIDQLHRTESEHDRMNLLTAIGCFSRPGLIDKSQAYLLDHVPDRNRFIPVTAMCQNPFAIPKMWDWYLQQYKKLEKSHPLIYERIIAAIIPSCGLRDPEAVKSFFADYVKEKTEIGDVVRLSIEKLDVMLQMAANG